MSLNRAVVTTSIGKRGLHSAFIPVEDFLLADEPNEFADAIVELLVNEDKNRQIANNALSKICSYYSESRFNEIVAKSIKK
jgi:spore maturation protein CgeB